MTLSDLEQIKESLSQLSAEDQDHVAGFLLVERLKRNRLVMPSLHYRFADPRGRTIEVKILGRHALFFFRDSYANVVKILDLRNVESL